eukprot:2352580-Prymnesium_polylepis.1
MYTRCTEDPERTEILRSRLRGALSEGWKAAHLRRKCVHARPANRATLTPATCAPNSNAAGSFATGHSRTFQRSSPSNCTGMATDLRRYAALFGQSAQEHAKDDS